MMFVNLVYCSTFPGQRWFSRDWRSHRIAQTSLLIWRNQLLEPPPPTFTEHDHVFLSWPHRKSLFIELKFFLLKNGKQYFLFFLFKIRPSKVCNVLSVWNIRLVNHFCGRQKIFCILAWIVRRFVLANGCFLIK